MKQCVISYILIQIIRIQCIFVSFVLHNGIIIIIVIGGITLLLKDINIGTIKFNTVISYVKILKTVSMFINNTAELFIFNISLYDNDTSTVAVTSTVD